MHFPQNWRQWILSRQISSRTDLVKFQVLQLFVGIPPQTHSICDQNENFLHLIANYFERHWALNVWTVHWTIEKKNQPILINFIKNATVYFSSRTMHGKICIILHAFMQAIVILNSTLYNWIFRMDKL